MVVLRQRTPQVFPQFVVILYYQYFLAVTGILSLLLGMFVTLYGRVDGRGVRSALSGEVICSGSLFCSCSLVGAGRCMALR